VLGIFLETTLEENKKFGQGGDEREARPWKVARCNYPNFTGQGSLQALSHINNHTSRFCAQVQ